MALPPLTASSEIEPEYEPEPNEDEVTWTVNVVLPLVRVAEAGETTNQFELVVVVAVGVMVTPFAQLLAQCSFAASDERGQGGGHTGHPTALGQHHPEAPQRQDGRLRFGEMRHVA